MRKFFVHIQLILIFGCMFLLLPVNFLLTGRWYYNRNGRFYHRIYTYVDNLIEEL